MSRISRLAAVPVAALLSLGLASCASDEPAGETEAASNTWEPVTVEHAFGTTTIETEPERVATVAWANHEVPLALGVVPVGMAASTFGDDDANGVHPWAEEALADLDAETPVLFDETDGIDFEAVADSQPDVILAAYSGLTQEDYDTLSEIAPVVAYPEAPWSTPWREMIEVNAAGLGMAEEGDELVADLEQQIADVVAEYPQIEGATGMFLTHVDPSDLSQVSFYSANDTRVQFFEDLGMEIPASIEEASADTDSYSVTISAEQADMFDDVDVIVTYGGEELRDALESDPLLSQIPAVENGAIVDLPGDQPLGTAANPTPLAISWVLDDYAGLIADAVDKGE
ncbi:iron-siderophore ABC transporter substrate-binding protein [Paraoerskovia marina]|uniref:Iron complex transport system substrate-binding protein n=1 Tax=Paraoerskovia marina TaxID=545619 RepID=A0A1H1RNJ5_9CELL|nr:iron-siderophore ABC transporter substrate-binding protein [Paraoerskovia marina]SDS37367.1 iron complex transport system substrate-binding protein [Paraoerskovia marina]